MQAADRQLHVFFRLLCGLGAGGVLHQVAAQEGQAPVCPLQIVGQHLQGDGLPGPEEGETRGQVEVVVLDLQGGRVVRRPGQVRLIVVPGPGNDQDPGGLVIADDRRLRQGSGQLRSLPVGLQLEGDEEGGGDQNDGDQGGEDCLDPAVPDLFEIIHPRGLLFQDGLGNGHLPVDPAAGRTFRQMLPDLLPGLLSQQTLDVEREQVLNVVAGKMVTHFASAPSQQIALRGRN